MKLLCADIVRDGGSLVAHFRKDDGNLLSLWLQVARSDGPPAPRDYRELSVSADLHPEKGRPLAPGSTAEAELFADLDHWLAAPHYSSEWAPGLDWEAGAFQRLQDLRSHAAKRSQL